MDHIKNQPNRDRTEPTGVEDAYLADPNLITQMSPWNLDFRQLETGPMETRIRARQGKILNLLEIRMDRAVHQTGMAPPETMTLGIPLTDGLPRWQNRRAPQGSLLSFGSSDGFEGLSGSNFHGLTFSAPISEVETLCERLGIALHDPLRASGVFSNQTDNRFLRRTVRTARECLSSNTPICRSDEEEILAGLLSTTVESAANGDQSSPRTRGRAVRVALELMEEGAADNLPLSLLCESAAVSERTLNRAFNERFYMGPKAYFLRLRLCRMRQDLLKSGPPNTTADIANRWGFWHMGQLARDYRKHFGELPSETLKRPPSRSQI